MNVDGKIRVRCCGSEPFALQTSLARTMIPAGPEGILLPVGLERDRSFMQFVKDGVLEIVKPKVVEAGPAAVMPTSPPAPAPAAPVEEKVEEPKPASKPRKAKKPVAEPPAEEPAPEPAEEPANRSIKS